MRTVGLIGVAVYLLTAAGVHAQDGKVVETTAFAACRDAADYRTAGRGVDPDKIDAPLAISLCEAALIEAPDHPALLAYLGRALGSAGRFDEALTAALRSSDAGDPTGQSVLGSLYRLGQGVPQDFAEALRLFQLSADQGHPAGQNNLGVLHALGQGVPQDWAEAARWYRISAEQGHAVAQNNLALRYLQGQGVPQDLAEAVGWFRLAADQEHRGAQFNLGVRYELGEGVAQDYAEAARWYRLAGEQGQPNAQASLASLYYRGAGVPQDHVEAARWYRLAADQGYAPAQNDLGVLYDRGEGVPQDDAEAVRWYRLAAEQGYPVAQNNLGEMYENGLGVPQDYAEAERWYRLAVEQGRTEAQADLDRVLGLIAAAAAPPVVPAQPGAEAPVAAAPSATPIDWYQAPQEFRGRNGELFVYVCPPLGNAGMGAAWGTDIYTDDSAICVAAVHSGVISTAGGAVTVEILPGQASYLASERNGISSYGYGSYDGSYRVIAAGGAAK